MRNRILYFLLLAMFLPVVKTSAQNVNLSNYILDWSDEFNGANTDFDEKWIAMNQNLNGWHLAGRWRENIEIHNGILEIYNKKETRGTNDWTSGSVWTQQQFSYGYFECKYMYAAATGVNNSFWLWPKTKTYREYDKYEIDINEGHYVNDISTNVHNWSETWVDANGKKKHTTNPKKFTMDGVNLGTEYHVYGFEWTPIEMKWYFDGKLIRTEANTTNHGPTNILLSAAILNLPSFVGPVTEAIDGTSMKVDNVRYYKPKK